MVSDVVDRAPEKAAQLDVDACVEQLSTSGHLLLEDFVAGDCLTQAQCEFRTYFPTFEEVVSAAREPGSFHHANPFPFSGPELNRLTVDERVLAIAQELLGGSALRLTSSFVQAKYGTAAGPSRDQQLHNDAWSTNSLLFPRTDGPYQRLYGILYLSNVDVDTAPTYVVGRGHTLGVPLLTGARQGTYAREDYPDLYEQERPVITRAGSLLLFVGDIVHRGSAMTAETGERDALFFNYHDAIASWTDKHLWGMRPSSPEWPEFARFIEGCSPLQRSVLGFPPPGDPYWDEATLEAVQDLYPGLDLSPYRAGLAGCPDD